MGQWVSRWHLFKKQRELSQPTDLSGDGDRVRHRTPPAELLRRRPQQRGRHGHLNGRRNVVEVLLLLHLHKEGAFALPADTVFSSVDDRAAAVDHHSAQLPIGDYKLHRVGELTLKGPTGARAQAKADAKAGALTIAASGVRQVDALSVKVHAQTEANDDGNGYGDVVTCSESTEPATTSPYPFWSTSVAVHRL